MNYIAKKGSVNVGINSYPIKRKTLPRQCLINLRRRPSIRQRLEREQALTSSERTHGGRTRDPGQRVPPVPAKAVHAEDSVPREGVDDLGIADSLVGDDSHSQGLADFAAEIHYL